MFTPNFIWRSFRICRATDWIEQSRIHRARHGFHETYDTDSIVFLLCGTWIYSGKSAVYWHGTASKWIWPYRWRTGVSTRHRAPRAVLMWHSLSMDVFPINVFYCSCFSTYVFSEWVPSRTAKIDSAFSPAKAFSNLGCAAPPTWPFSARPRVRHVSISCASRRSIVRVWEDIF